MWIRRTSRGRRDLPLSFSDVDGICAGWEAGAGVVVGGAAVVADCVGGCCCCCCCCEGAEAAAVALLDWGSAGGVRGWVEGAAWDWPGDAILRWCWSLLKSGGVKAGSRVGCCEEVRCAVGG